MKERYIQFCEENQGLPIFFKPWWLDIDCNGRKNWDAIVVESNGTIQAVLPYYKRKVLFFSTLDTPPIAPYLGYKVIYPEHLKASNKIAFENKVLQKLIDKIPSAAYIKQYLSYEEDNWMPFFWNNFKQTIRYSYILRNDLPILEIYNNFKPRLRNDIKKAESKILIKKEYNAALFHRLLSESFESQSLKVPYSISTIKKLLDGCQEYDCGDMYIAVDEKDICHASCLIIKDRSKAFAILRANNRSIRQIGAQNFMLWSIIQDLFKAGFSSFDFCGSMQYGINKFIQGYSAEQTPYYQISKSNSFLFTTLRGIKRMH